MAPEIFPTCILISAKFQILPHSYVRLNHVQLQYLLPSHSLTNHSYPSRFSLLVYTLLVILMTILSIHPKLSILHSHNQFHTSFWYHFPPHQSTSRFSEHTYIHPYIHQSLHVSVHVKLMTCSSQLKSLIQHCIYRSLCLISYQSWYIYIYILPTSSL